LRRAFSCYSKHKYLLHLSKKESQITAKHILWQRKKTNSPFFVGFDIANIAGLVEVEPFIASKTFNTISQQ